MSRHRYDPVEKQAHRSRARRNPVPGRHVRVQPVQDQGRNHPKLAVIVAAGAFTVATAATTTAVTWPSGGAAAVSSAGAGAAAGRAGAANLDAAGPSAVSQAPAGASAGLTAFDQAQAALESQQFKYQTTLHAEQAAALAKAAARQKAAKQAAAVAAAKQTAATAAAQAAASAQAAANAAAQKQSQQQTRQTSASAPASGTPEQIAQAMLSQFGWSSDQMSCLEPLWQRESGWEVSAYNAGSGAYGIPQALPGSKMASAGSDWQTSAATQIKWGLGYIQQIYGSPCAAWSHEEADGWY